MSFCLDYSEPLAATVEKLERRHTMVSELINEVEQLAEDRKVAVSISLLTAAAPLILRTAVEEEAKVMRDIMQRAPESADPSIAVMRGHRHVSKFLRHRLQALGTLPADEARSELLAFTRFVREHEAKEDVVVFGSCAPPSP